MSLPANSRIIGLDLHPRRFGYAVMEVGKTLDLLDYGISGASVKSKNIHAVLVNKRLRRLMRMLKPSYLIVKEPLPRRLPKVHRLIELARKEARSARTSFRTLNNECIARAFGNDSITKYRRATMLARRFPALQWKLPLRRKLYESEDYRMPMFDAAAFSLAYAAKRGVDVWTSGIGETAKHRKD